MQNDTTRSISQANVVLGGVALFGLIIAAFLGVIIGGSEIQSLVLLFGISVGLLFLLRLYQYVWQMAFFLIFVGFGYHLTFKFGPTEASCALGVGLIAIFFWQKKSIERPAILEGVSFDWMRATLFVWILYVALHFVFNYKLPYRPGDFVLTNAVKSYFPAFVPFLLFFYFSKYPTGIIVRETVLRTLLRISFVGLIFNVAIRVLELGGVASGLFIPIINAATNSHILRTQAPFAMLLATVALTGSTPRRLLPSPILLWTLLGLGAFGSVVSGGRASVGLGFAFVAVTLAFRRKIGFLIVAATIGLIGVAIANVFSDWINQNGNIFLQRSLQMVLVEKAIVAQDTIESSSLWRRELADRAFAEWMSNPRIFWTGRATYGFGSADELTIDLTGGYKGMMEISLRRGATHNMITDLLVAYGLIGLVLYLVAYLSMLRFFWRVKPSRLSPPARDLRLMCLVGALVYLGLDTVGGGTIRIELVWLAIVFTAFLYSDKAGVKKTPKVDVMPEPQAARLVARRERAVVKRVGIRG